MGDETPRHMTREDDVAVPNAQWRAHAPKTAELVAARIRTSIVRGELKPGDYLPPARQLATALSISHPTLREVLRVLEAEQFIVVAHGSRHGARICHPNVETVARYAGFILQARNTPLADIYESRLAIEPYVARKLAETQPEGVAGRLRARTDRMIQLADDRRFTALLSEASAFHRQLMEAGGNHTLLFLSDMVRGILLHHQAAFVHANLAPPDEQRRRAMTGAASCAYLIDLIAAGDGDAAERHWHEHIRDTNHIWLIHGGQDGLLDVLDSRGAD